VWAALLPLAVSPFLIAGNRVLAVYEWGPAHTVPLATIVVLMLAYLAAWARTKSEAWIFRASLLPWLIACCCAAVVLAIEIRLAAMLPKASALIIIAIFGPAAAMLVHLCLSAVFVALRAEVRRSDLDREWLARLSAVKFLPMVLWSALAAACLLGTIVLDALPSWKEASGWLTTASAVVTAVAGASAALFGSSSKSSAMFKRLSWLDVAAALCTVVFVVGLLALLSYLGAVLLDLLLDYARPWVSALAGLVLAGGVRTRRLVAWQTNQCEPLLAPGRLSKSADPGVPWLGAYLGPRPGRCAVTARDAARPRPVHGLRPGRQSASAGADAGGWGKRGVCSRCSARRSTLCAAPRKRDRNARVRPSSSLPPPVAFNIPTPRGRRSWRQASMQGRNKEFATSRCRG